jgi:hypothetical protein
VAGAAGAADRVEGIDDSRFTFQEMNRTRQHHSDENGQAMVELVIAMVAILAVCAGLLQVSTLTKAQTDALFEARKKASEHVFSDAMPMGSPEYIRYWKEGPDGKAMTADDLTTAANGSQFAATIVEKSVATADDWPIIEKAPDDVFLQLHGNAMPITKFGLVGGEATRSVDLIPAVQHLLYRADSIDLESKVWMTWTRGIY